MNEVNVTAKKAFSGIGLIYTVLSAVVTGLQLVVSAIGVAVQNNTSIVLSVDLQIMINSAILYVIGLLILQVGLKKQSLPVIELEKHSMSLGDILKAFCMCYAVLIASNVIGLMITTAIGILKGSPIVNPVEALASEMSIPILFVFTVICAPIFEELFFRKLIIDRVVSFGEVPAVLLSGFMFGLFHGNLSQFPYAFTIGIFFGVIYVRTGKILYPIILHAMVNFMGSVASVIVLKGVSTELMNGMATATTDAELLGLFTAENLIGLVGLLVFELIIFIIVIIGIILWILNRKKIAFYTRTMDMPRGTRFKTVVVNPGMIAYIILWMGMIIYSLF